MQQTFNQWLQQNFDAATMADITETFESLQASEILEMENCGLIVECKAAFEKCKIRLAEVEASAVENSFSRYFETNAVVTAVELCVEYAYG